MARALGEASFCVPQAAQGVEAARAFAKSRSIGAIRSGCAATASRPDSPAKYVPCNPEVMRKRTEERLHALELFPRSKGLSMATYIMARNIASEVDSGAPGVEHLVIGEALLNRAQTSGDPITKIAMWNGRYFAQQSGSNPAVATARDPNWEDIVAAEYVMAGMSGGVSRGATHYFGPRAQDRMHKLWLACQKGDKAACERIGNRRYTKDAAEVIRRWSKWGRWVGHVPGIDIRSQMFFRDDRPSDAQTLAAALTAVRESSPAAVMKPPQCAEVPGVPASIALVLGLGALAAGALGLLYWKRAIR
jgi:hypothetical protein